MATAAKATDSWKSEENLKRFSSGVKLLAESAIRQPLPCDASLLSEVVPLKPWHLRLQKLPAPVKVLLLKIW